MRINKSISRNTLLNISVFLYIVTLFTVASHDTYYILNRLTFFLMLLAFIIKIFKIEFIVGKAPYYTFPFYLTLIISNIWAYDINTSLHRTIGISFYYLGGLIIYICLLNNLIKERVIKISFIISVFILSISALNEYLVLGVTRASGITQNANTFGINIVMLGILLLILQRKNKSLRTKIVDLVVLTSIINAAIISGSRKVIIATVMLFIYLIVSNAITKLSKLKIAIFSITLVVFGIILIVNTNIVIDYLSHIKGVERLLERDDHSFEIRGSMIETALNLFKERPLLGYGIDNFRIVSNFGAYSHNNYTELLVSVGLVGAFIYYFIYFSLFRFSINIFNRVNNKDILLFTVFFICLTLVQEVALVTINSPRNWIILFIVFWINEKEILRNIKTKKVLGYV